ncbi:MAG: glycosyltransferase family 1 protein [bacterium]
MPKNKKLSIALDGNEANVVERVGTGQYAFNILTRWAGNTTYDFHIYLRTQPVADMPKAGKNWHYHVVGPNKAWTRLALPLALAQSHQHDVFWNPAHYLPPFTFGKSVVTIHDLAYEYFPELFLPKDLYQLTHWTKASVKHATHVIAVSSATKRDLVKLYRVPAGKISVIYNGYDQDIFNTKFKLDPKKLQDHSLSSGAFILFVGTIQPRKNLINLIHAFGIMKDHGYKGKLVIAGKVGWLADDTLAAVAHSSVKDDIVLTGYISDETRQLFNRYASVVVLPSLYEGFGMPLIEAMASGTPVAGSNNSSIPEVVGKGGELFDPSSPDSIAAAIFKVINSRTSYSKQALAQAAKFSWDKCADETLKALVEVQ